MKGPKAAIAEVTPRYAWVIVATGFSVTLTTIGAGRYLYPIVMPQMKEELGLNYGLAGALSSATMVGYLVSCVLGGMLAVRFGSKAIIALSTAALGLAMIGQAFVSLYAIAFLLMLVIGLGAGGAFIPAGGLVAAWVAPSRRGLFMSIVILGANFGILAVALLGPIILLANGGTGWRPAWVYFGLAAILVAAASLVLIRDRPPEAAGRQGGLPQSPGSSSLNWGAVFRNRAMLQLTTAYFFHGFFSVYAVFIIAFATQGLGHSTQFAGSLWSFASVLSAATLILWGHLADAWGRKQTMIPCATVLCAGILLPVLRQDDASLWVSAFLFGIAYVGPMTIITTVAGDLAGPGMAAAAMGLVTMGHGLGQMAGPAIAGFLIDLTGSFYPGFLIASAAILVEIIVVASLPLGGDRRGAEVKAG